MCQARSQALEIHLVTKVDKNSCASGAFLPVKRGKQMVKLLSILESNECCGKKEKVDQKVGDQECGRQGQV